MMSASRAAFLIASLSVGCYLGASGTPDAGDAGPSPDGGIGVSTGSWEQRVMHRLTRVEYDHTVRDLLGEPTSVASELPEDQTSALGYDNDGVALVTSPLLVERYFDVAGELAANLFGRLHPYAQPLTIVSEPNFGVPCSGLVAGQICGNDAGAWWNGDPNTGVWGIRPSLPNVPNDMVADGVTVPLAGTYDFS